MTRTPWLAAASFAILLAAPAQPAQAQEADPTPIVEIMRAFVCLRQLITTLVELARKLVTIERKYDAQFKVVFDAIRELMTPIVPAKKGEMGFHTRISSLKPKRATT